MRCHHRPWIRKGTRKCRRNVLLTTCSLTKYLARLSASDAAKFDPFFRQHRLPISARLFRQTTVLASIAQAVTPSTIGLRHFCICMSLCTPASHLPTRLLYSQSTLRPDLPSGRQQATRSHLGLYNSCSCRFSEGRCVNRLTPVSSYAFSLSMRRFVFHLPLNDYLDAEALHLYAQLGHSELDDNLWATVCIVCSPAPAAHTS